MAEIIEFNPPPQGDDADAPLRSRGWARHCSHARIDLDHEQSRVFCRDCEREVTAWDGLVMLAREFERWVAARDRARKEAERLALEVENLKREVRNLKAQKKRAAKARVLPTS